MKHIVWILVILLIVLHQDRWFWDDGTLVFGILPVGLLYHMGLSLAASLIWFLATRYAWPDDVELPSGGAED